MAHLLRMQNNEYVGRAGCSGNTAPVHSGLPCVRTSGDGVPVGGSTLPQIPHVVCLGPLSSVAVAVQDKVLPKSYQVLHVVQVLP